MTNAPQYRTGEVIMKGDHVRLDILDAIVDFIMTPNASGWDKWSEFGEGVMLDRPDGGNLYVRLDYEELTFVSRAPTENQEMPTKGCMIASQARHHDP
jgi:hypothetical protein